MDFEKATTRELLEYFLRTRDPAAWAEFQSRTSPTIRGVIARSLARWATDSLLDDLEQNAFLKLIVNEYKVLRTSTWSHDNSIYSYVKVAARGVAIDFLRKKSIRSDEMHVQLRT